MKASYWVAMFGLGASTGAQAMQPRPPQMENYLVEVIKSDRDQCPIDEVLANMQADPKYLNNLKAESQGNNKIRILNAKQPMTMDYRIDRLTIVVDDENKTIKMRCV